MNNIIWETTLYENSDVNVGQMEIQFCCKCREEIVKECYTIERMNRNNENKQVGRSDIVKVLRLLINYKK